jgi:sulfide dehydrogenase cytochrome subunit
MRHLPKSLSAAFLSVLGGLAVAGPCLAVDIGRATVLAFNCTACHGPAGLGSRSIPKIRGLDREDIMQSMKGFRSGEESGTIMGRIVKGYSNEEFELLADYFSAVEPR